MALRNARSDSPAVQIPSAAGDSPSWARVAVIAGIGFAVGVAWPRLAGIRPGPSVPEPASAQATGASMAAVPAPGSAVASAPAPVPSPSPEPPHGGPVAAAAAPAPPAATEHGTPGVRVTVSHGFVSSCRAVDGELLHGGDCGDLAGLDGVVLPRLRKLADCPAAADTNGKLHLTLRADFTHGTLTADVGRGHNVANADPLVACARAAVADASLGGIRHESARYTVAYLVTLASSSDGADAPAASGGPAAAESPPAARLAASDGTTVQVAWDGANVRDAPRTGKVIARLPKGTSIKIGPVNDGWYPIKYGDDFASEGWLYRGAIGR